MTHECDDIEINVISRDEMAAGAQKALRTLFKRLDTEADTMPLGELADVALTLVKIDAISMRDEHVAQGMILIRQMLATLQGATASPAAAPEVPEPEAPAGKVAATS